MTSCLSSIYYGEFDMLYTYGKKFTPDIFLIEDAIQNVFVSLIVHEENLPNIKNIRSYLLISFRNELIRLINRSRNFTELDQCFGIEATTEYDKEEDEQNNRLKKDIENYLLNNATSKQREILYLKYNVGLSYEDISEILNIKVESCRTLVYRTIKKMSEDPNLIKKEYL